MKKNSYILAGLMAMSGLICAVHAQNKNLPPPNKDIPHDKEPAVVTRVNPVYPESMLSGGWEATVYMKAFIDIDGTVKDARSEKIQIIATTNAEKTDESTERTMEGKAFEEASYAAVIQWKFSPAQMQGKPVAVWVTIPFRFKLSTKETKPEEEANRMETEKESNRSKRLLKIFSKERNWKKPRSILGKPLY